MRVFALVLLLGLSACGGSIMAPPVNHTLPMSGPIVYSCANGAQLTVDVTDSGAQVAIVGGPSMVLPGQGGAYSNGRYTFRGGGDSASWQTPGAAPVTCHGG